MYIYIYMYVCLKEDPFNRMEGKESHQLRGSPTLTPAHLDMLSQSVTEAKPVFVLKTIQLSCELDILHFHIFSTQTLSSFASVKARASPMPHFPQTWAMIQRSTVRPEPDVERVLVWTMFQTLEFPKRTCQVPAVIIGARVIQSA